MAKAKIKKKLSAPVERKAASKAAKGKAKDLPLETSKVARRTKLAPATDRKPTIKRKATTAEIQRSLEILLAQGFGASSKDARLLAKQFAENDEMGDLIDPALIEAIAELIKQYGHYAETALHLLHIAEIAKWFIEKIRRKLALGEATLETTQGRLALMNECLTSI